jgi:hypothetical protein
MPVVLFCGVPIDVGLVPSADRQLRLGGSVWGVGEDSIAAVALHHDAVDDALAVGPHLGELFAGTSGGTQGRLETTTRGTQEWWASTRSQLDAAQGAAARHLRGLLQHPALRISVVASRVHGVWVGVTEATAWRDLSSVPWGNHTSDLGWHGPECRGALTLEVPAGSTVVVVTLGMAGTVTAR